MKNYLATAAVAAFGFVTAAQAADMPVKAPAVVPAAGPTFYFEAAFIDWTRSKPDGTATFSTAAAPGTGNLFRSDQFDTQWRPGAEARLGWHITNYWGFEIGGFGLEKHRSTPILVSPGIAAGVIDTTPPTNYGLTGAAVINSYTSTIWGFEANGTWQMRPGFVLLAGPRYINLAENYSITGYTLATGIVFEVDTWNPRNNLWGGQVGARFDFMTLFAAPQSPWIFNGDVRFGVYDNRIQNATYRGNGLNNFNQVLFTGITDQVAWSAQGGLNVGYQFGNGMAFTVGYEALWINGVALAPNQVGVTPNFSASFNTPQPPMGVRTEDVLYHGLKVALIVRR